MLYLPRLYHYSRKVKAVEQPVVRINPLCPSELGLGHPERDKVERLLLSELIHHAWLESVVVQGELDVIRRAEEEDKRRKEMSEAAEEPSARRDMRGQDLDGADALKPVDDQVPTEEEADEPREVPKLSIPVPSSSTAKENVHPKDNMHLGRGVPTLHTLPTPKGHAPPTEHKR